MPSKAGALSLSEEVRTKRVTLKVEDDRTVTAKFATFGVRDLDGDIIEAGAIGEQSVLLGAFNHNPGLLPPGSGKTYEEDGGAMFKGTFFTTSSGNDLYETLKGDKAAGDIMEWSFRFFVQEGAFETVDGEESFMIRKARVTHVAPVESAAGIDTGTVEIKCDGCDAKAADWTVETNLIDYAKLAAAVAATQVIDYEKLAGAVATAVAAAMGKSIKGGCGCKDGQNKGDSLGSLIRTLRDEKELTNDDLAEAAGLSVDTIGQILGGTLKCPKASRLEGLAARLEVNLSSLVEAFEADGCGTYLDDAQASAADQGGDKGAEGQADAATEPAAANVVPRAPWELLGKTDPDDAATKDGDDGSDETKATDPPEGSLEHQVEALLSGFPGLPAGIDPGIAAFEKYQDAIGAKESNRG